MKRFIAWLKHVFGLCAHEGCWREGVECSVPGAGGQPSTREFWCDKHCHAAGFCRSCGEFYAGVDSFDFSKNGLCENCDSELRYDLGENDDDGELWDES